MKLLPLLVLLIFLAGCAVDEPIVENTTTNNSSDNVVIKTITVNDSEPLYYETVYSGDLFNNGSQVKIVQKRYQ